MVNLKTNQDPKQFEDWLKEVDIPFVSSLSSVKKFQVLKVEHLFNFAAEPPFQYVEIIDLKSLEQFSQEYAQEQAQKIAAKFRQFCDEPILLISESIV